MRQDMKVRFRHRDDNPERTQERKYKWPCISNPGNLYTRYKLGMFEKSPRSILKY